ncbi:MAG: exodeoxyribonuclease VII small subunit [Candidatus Thermoplasmatota archaeon]
MTRTAQAEVPFAEELKQLEKAIRDLESGKLDLDDALKRFEEGVALTRKLRTRLDAAEGKIEQLLEDGTTRPLDMA